MFRRIAYCLLLCILGAPASLSAANTDEVGLFVRFFEKKIYYLNRTEDIRIKVSVVNNSLEAYRFKVADDVVFNQDFEVKTPANEQLHHSQEFTIKRGSIQYVFFKEIVLKPGEEFGFIVRLDRFITFDRAGLFSVQGIFYPELLRENRSVALRSNRLSLNVRPPIEVPKLLALVEQETGRIIEREILPPDEVVDFTIRARQKSQWEKFLLYIDVERLLLRQPEWRARFEKSPEEERLRLIDEYRGMLKNELVDQDILVIPNEFEIQATTYTAHEGQVTVLEKFKYRDYTELKSYTYYLERRDRHWMITNYEVKNLGTE